MVSMQATILALLVGASVPFFATRVLAQSAPTSACVEDAGSSYLGVISGTKAEFAPMDDTGKASYAAKNDRPIHVDAIACMGVSGALCQCCALCVVRCCT